MNAVENQILKNQLTILNYLCGERNADCIAFNRRVDETKDLLMNEMQNKPLTLDELREMDGEPVWVVTGSAINAGRGCWDICDWWDKNTVMFPYSGEQPRVDDYGITWTAYRRRPEEVTK